MAKDKKTAGDEVQEEQNSIVSLFDDDEIITLQDDEGNDVNFCEVACIEYEGENYSFLQPIDTIDGIDEGEVIIFRVEDDESDEEYCIFVPVEDEALLDKIFLEYQRAVADSEYGCDCDCDHGDGHECDCDHEGCDCKK